MIEKILASYRTQLLAGNFKNLTVLYMIVFAVIVNAIALFMPTLSSNDPYFYGVIIKNMAASGDWVNLYYFAIGQDWLDKPHLSFWLETLSSMVFGFNQFGYAFPGFIFQIIGACYTYKLGKRLFNHETGLLAVLIYVTSFHLLVSLFDLRMEAYLLGEIIPACYYWLVYEKTGGKKSLLAGGFFTGLALMTKGPFVVLPIFSGVVFRFFFEKRWLEFLRPKWLLAYFISMVFALPELICLYLQFDLHPEKVVFGTTGMSGLWWYFWGNQFGRYLQTGPLVQENYSIFFYIHTMAWGFLPWSVVFGAALYGSIRWYKRKSPQVRQGIIYLHACFWPTFLLFSTSKFQLDHYTNILFPFAAILCANYLVERGIMASGNEASEKTGWLTVTQYWLGLTISLLAAALTIVAFRSSWMIVFAIIPLSFLVLAIALRTKFTVNQRVLYLPGCSVLILFVTFIILNIGIFAHYNLGYNLAKIVNSQPSLSLYTMDNWHSNNSLAFHSRARLQIVSEPPKNYPYYLAINAAKKASIAKYNYEIIGVVEGLDTNTPEWPLVVNKAKLQRQLAKYELVKINGLR